MLCDEFTACGALPGRLTVSRECLQRAGDIASGGIQVDIERIACLQVAADAVHSRMDQQFHSIWNRQTAGIAGYGLSDMQIFPAKNENSPSKKQNGSNE